MVLDNNVMLSALSATELHTVVDRTQPHPPATMYQGGCQIDCPHWAREATHIPPEWQPSLGPCRSFALKLTQVMLRGILLHFPNPT